MPVSNLVVQPQIAITAFILGPVCDIWQNYIRNSYIVTQKCSTREKNAQNADIHGFREFMFFLGAWERTGRPGELNSSLTLEIIL